MKWLHDNGFVFKTVHLTSGDTGIMVNTDYNGPYPTKECLHKQDTISKKVRRCKSLRAEQRGYYTAMLITEAAP